MRHSTEQKQNPSARAGHTKKLVTLAMMAALSYLLVVLIHIPIFPAAPFLTYEPKDVIIAIAGFIYGPLEAFVIALIVSVFEMITISSTGPIGAAMNLLSTAAFCCTASLIYRHRRSLKGAVLGLLAGIAAQTLIMMLWNYLLTPIYMGAPRQAVVAMLIPIIMPFNLIKGGLNAAIAMLIYDPIAKGLRAARLIPPSSHTASPADRRKTSLAVTIISALVLLGLILAALAIAGIL